MRNKDLEVGVIWDLSEEEKKTGKRCKLLRSVCVQTVSGYAVCTHRQICFAARRALRAPQGETLARGREIPIDIGKRDISK